jgi:hypothetical protein
MEDAKRVSFLHYLGCSSKSSQLFFHLLQPNLHRGRRTSSNLVNYLKDNDKDERDSSLRSLCTHGASDSLYVWSEETMNELKRRGGNLQRHQLDAVSYLWEICHDLLLEKNSNMSISPGFESLGLRLNEKRGRYMLSNKVIIYLVVFIRHIVLQNNGSMSCHCSCDRTSAWMIDRIIPKGRNL